MTLTARLLVFFLTTLAVVLIAFSVTLYFVASDYLYWRADEQVEAALSELSESTAKITAVDGAVAGPADGMGAGGARRVGDLLDSDRRAR